MKKMTLASLMAASLLTISTAAFAQNNPQGGFKGPNAEIAVVSVEQAKGLNDDTMVILKGNIKQGLGNEMYLFQDSTGTINVEIDDEDWNGLNVGPDDVVIIKGEVDKGWTKIEIDVDEVSLAK